jgi:CRP-like cAMP-binding protein
MAMNPGSVPQPDGLIARLRALAADRWAERAWPRGGTLLNRGDPDRQVFVLTAGLVKLAYPTPAGDEWIKSFIADQGVFGGADGPGGSSRFSAIVLEPARVAALPSDWVAARAAEDPALSLQLAAFNAWLAARKQAREEALLCLSAEQRYLQMLRTEPALAARLPQGDIARYLRVTPVAFSRIKRRLAGSP